MQILRLSLPEQQRRVRRRSPPSNINVIISSSFQLSPIAIISVGTDGSACSRGTEAVATLAARAAMHNPRMPPSQQLTSAIGALQPGKKGKGAGAPAGKGEGKGKGGIGIFQQNPPDAGKGKGKGKGSMGNVPTGAGKGKGKGKGEGEGRGKGAGQRMR